jgi:hypothetical protein
MARNGDWLLWSARTLRTGMLGLCLAACSNAVARVPEDRDALRATGGIRALDRTLVAGTLIEATINQTLSWRRNTPGEPLTAIVSADVRNAHRWVVIPAGSALALRVPRRPSTTMLLDVVSVTVRGRANPVRATMEVAPAAAGDVAVESGARVLFVLSEGFTAERRHEVIP